MLLALGVLLTVLPAWGMKVNSMRAKGRIISRGTTENQVLKWLGEPDHKKIITVASQTIGSDTIYYKQKEIWYYERGSLGTYRLYFGNGKVYKIEFVR